MYSEAAVWLAHGLKGTHGLEAYRDRRKSETDKIPKFKDGDCFHDGEKSLEAVREYHNMVLRALRTEDYVTKNVLNDMVAEMLDYKEYRPTAQNLWGKVIRITEKARIRLYLPKTAAFRNQPHSFESPRT